ncbi:hypothetical protein A0U92_10385 [Acetobacter aceti]|uniref:Uncharacterized protein n=1 Tax=Acetobacter aceti TaxID=435 RepID=A0A1U9KH43_ACEAC|nr:hypothetical protein A0U92_10385 [Acetobacter aceti]
MKQTLLFQRCEISSQTMAEEAGRLWVVGTILLFLRKRFMPGACVRTFHRHPEACHLGDDRLW